MLFKKIECTALCMAVICYSALHVMLSCVVWFCSALKDIVHSQGFFLCVVYHSTVFHCISLHCVVTRQVHKGLKDYTHPQKRCQKWASRT